VGSHLRFADESNLFSDALIRFGAQLLDPLSQNAEHRELVIGEFRIPTFDCGIEGGLAIFGGPSGHVLLRQLVVQAQRFDDVVVFASGVELPARGRRRLFDANNGGVGLFQFVLRGGHRTADDINGLCEYGTWASVG
jgi:hypothetical protein